MRTTKIINTKKDDAKQPDTTTTPTKQKTKESPSSNNENPPSTSPTRIFRLLGPFFWILSCLLSIKVERSAILKYQRLEIALDHAVEFPHHEMHDVLWGDDKDDDDDKKNTPPKLFHFSTVNLTSSFTYQTQATPPVIDPYFPLTLPPNNHNILRLIRVVEIYQWVETKKVIKMRVADTTSNDNDHDKDKIAAMAGGMMSKYDYQQKWTKRPIKSTHFHYPQGHVNVGSLPKDLSGGMASFTITPQLDIQFPNHDKEERTTNFRFSIRDWSMLQQLRRQEPLKLRLLSPDEEEEVITTTTTTSSTDKEDADISSTANTAILTSLPEGFELRNDALFLRTTEQVPVEDEDDEDGNDTKSTRIVEESIVLDGETKRLYKVNNGESSYSTRQAAEEAILLQTWIQVQTLTLDGQEQTIYKVVEGEGGESSSSSSSSYTSRQKALEHATRLQTAKEEYEASLPAAQRNKKFKFLPQIGDVRVRFFQVTVPKDLSILAQWSPVVEPQEDESSWILEPWYPPFVHPHGDDDDKDAKRTSQGIGLLAEGYLDAATMIRKAQRGDSTLVTSWTGRLGAFLLALIGSIFVSHFGSQMSIVETWLLQPFWVVLGSSVGCLIAPLWNGAMVAGVLWSTTLPSRTKLSRTKLWTTDSSLLRLAGSLAVYGVLRWFADRKRKHNVKSKLD